MNIQPNGQSMPKMVMCKHCGSEYQSKVLSPPIIPEFHCIIHYNIECDFDIESSSELKNQGYLLLALVSISEIYYKWLNITYCQLSYENPFYGQ